MAQLPPYLIIDDEDDDMFILKRLLTKAGVENKGVTFQDPLIAIGYLEAELRTGNELLIPFLILTDLNMPTMSGFELVTWVRSQPKMKKTAVVMLSTSQSPSDAERAVALGADRFLPKFPTASVMAEVVKAAGGGVIRAV